MTALPGASTELAVVTSSKYFGLHPDVRGEVDKLLSAVLRIGRSKRKCAASKAEAEALGVSYSAMRGYVGQYKRHGWEGLIDERKATHEAANLPGVFVDYWKALCEENQRKCKPAWRKLIRAWRSGRPIKGFDSAHPGYDNSPAPEIRGIPCGWSYSNLMRHKPTRFELTLARQGPIAASELALQTFTTRVGLRPMEWIAFDDLWHDLLTTVSWVRSPLRPLELACHDIFSAHKVKYGLKPMIKGDDGKRVGLVSEDMRYLLASVFIGIGVNRSGLNVLTEHGTATMPKDVQEFLLRHSPVPLRFIESGIQGAQALAGGFPGLGRGDRRDAQGNRVGFYSRGLGNFRLKASLESSHNLYHNETADLPGQTGMDRAHSPENLPGLVREWEHMWTACKALHPIQAAQLEAGLLTFQRFNEILTEVHWRIQKDHEHALEGWRDCGLMKSVYRLDLGSENWRPMEELWAMEDEKKRDAILAFVTGNEGYAWERRMSRWEAFQHKADLVKFPEWFAPFILGPKLKTTRSVQDSGEIIVRDREIGDDPVRYLAMALTQDGQRVPIHGSFDTWVNPFDQDTLFVCETAKDAVGAYVGICQRRDKLTRGDQEAIQASWNENRKAYYSGLQGPRRRGLRLLQLDKQRLEKNNEALASKPMTDAERRLQEARDAADTGALSDLAEVTPAPAAPAEIQPEAEGSLSDLI